MYIEFDEVDRHGLRPDRPKAIRSAVGNEPARDDHYPDTGAGERAVGQHLLKVRARNRVLVLCVDDDAARNEGRTPCVELHARAARHRVPTQADALVKERVLRKRLDSVLVERPYNRTFEEQIEPDEVRDASVLLALAQTDATQHEAR
jgi:hypothetical protein